MALKYKNSCEFLASHFDMVSTVQDYIDTKRFIFTCKISGHRNELTTASFTNKKCKVALDDFCIGCVQEKENQKHTKEFITEMEEKTGHRILSVNFTTREMEYECGTCLTKQHTFVSSFKNNTGVCSHCQNWSFRLKYDYLKKEVEKYGLTLVTPEKDYTGNKQLLDIICCCGKPYKMILTSIRQDKKCMECKSVKYKETCMKTYGVENVMHVPEIFIKNQSASFKRKVFELPSGKEVSVMGYEPKAIQDLLDEGITEDQMVFGKDIPSFMYEQDGTHKYYPDCFIPHLNLIIEVKSEHTFVSHMTKNKLKCLSVINSGYGMRMMIYDDRNVEGYKIVLTYDKTFYTVNQVEEWFDSFLLSERNKNKVDRFEKITISNVFEGAP